MPIVILIGKVMASAIGKKSPGFDWGTDIFIAAGTAIYEALAARIAKMNLLEISCVINELNNATIQPFTIGITMAKIIGNHPKDKNVFNFLPLVTPMSSKKIARNPLNKSLVNGLIPSACLALAK